VQATVIGGMVREKSKLKYKVIGIGKKQEGKRLTLMRGGCLVNARREGECAQPRIKLFEQSHSKSIGKETQ